MADEPEDIRTFKEKALFYTTAFFVLLGTFSLFAFLFLVPFVIDPAFTTIFMQFDIHAAQCVTVETESFKGASNCSWTSCREGCTKEVYECTQIRVNYKIWKPPPNVTAATNATAQAPLAGKAPINTKDSGGSLRFARALRDEYDYADADANAVLEKMDDKSKPGSASGPDSAAAPGFEFMEYPEQTSELTGLMGNDSEWFFTGARLFPNVKGCGYPPMLNCSIWGKKYKEVGSNFSCYYSKVDPGLVISDLDMWQNTLNLVYAMAIPIPSFIISVIYLTFAYFKIYNEDEETAPLDKNAEDMAGEDVQNVDGIAEGGSDEVGTDLEEVGGDGGGGAVSNGSIGDGGRIGGEGGEEEDDDLIVPNGGIVGGVTSTGSIVSEPITPNSSSDMASFGHQLKVKMADEMSRESLDGGLMSMSGSIQG